MAFYANVIVDISSEKVDKAFQYRIPEELFAQIYPGVQVVVPFGNRKMTGYVIEVTDQAEIDPQRIRPLMEIAQDSISIEGQMIRLAIWIRRNFGGTLNHALKTVLPVKQRQKEKEKRQICFIADQEQAEEALQKFQKKHSTARIRLLEAVRKEKVLPYEVATQQLKITRPVITALEEMQLIRIETVRAYRNPVSAQKDGRYQIELNAEQTAAVRQISPSITGSMHEVFLLHGVTGSGKTEVYMELIARTIAEGKQAIVLIPEIALTYQTVKRFYQRFGDRVSIMNSRLSSGERYDQFERAQKGEIDIMIGPRSALFTPFPDLGIIIMDEEHETSYKSETLPRYHAREVAIERARMSDAVVVLGSATPSVESFYKAKVGEYKLVSLKERARHQALPQCHVVDLRQELMQGNRSILSRQLQQLMEERLNRKEQIMLFLNRRGVAGFVSCRACGTVLKCPHCDVSLSQHNNGKLVCHYCGYEQATPKVCPDCGSKYIGGFKAGTQKIEQIVQQRFPQAKILRMDTDTTRSKDSYEKILTAFSKQEADILIGTQMIVKGHDFPKVTLVGVLAADMSLNISDYHGPERTFQLLTQAAGRAGRGDLSGEVVIQTYKPEHYSIETAAQQEYEQFYQQEIAYRRLLQVPPFWHHLSILIAARDEMRAMLVSEVLKKTIQQHAQDHLLVLGPASASIGKVKDVYRKVLNCKHADYMVLVQIKEELETFLSEHKDIKDVTVQFDFDPVSGC